MNRSAENPHVLLVRAGSLNRTDESRGALQALMCDWFRANWPVIVYIKKHRGSIHNGFGKVFSEVSIGSRRFPVCSCVSPPGERDRSAVFTHITGLKHRCIECLLNRSANNIEAQCNKRMFEAIVRRIGGVRTFCYVSSSDRHRYQSHLSDGTEERPAKTVPEPGSDSVGSATALQRHPGIEFEVAAGQHDQGVDGSVLEVAIDEALLASFGPLASAVKVGSMWEGFSGDARSCAQVLHLLIDDGSASTDGCPGMFPIAALLIHDVLPVVCRRIGNGGDLS